MSHYFGRRSLEGLWAAAVPGRTTLLKAAVAAAGGLACIHGAAPLVFAPLGGLFAVLGYGILWVGLAPLIVPPLQFALDRAADLILYLWKTCHGLR